MSQYSTLTAEDLAEWADYAAEQAAGYDPASDIARGVWLEATADRLFGRGGDGCSAIDDLIDAA